LRPGERGVGIGGKGREKESKGEEGTHDKVAGTARKIYFAVSRGRINLQATSEEVLDMGSGGKKKENAARREKNAGERDWGKKQNL